MICNLAYEPLSGEHVDELAALLLNEPVYRYIGNGQPPARDEFCKWVHRVVAGPPRGRPGEEWVNYVVRRQGDGALVGRLEATLHAGIGEVAFLYGAVYWGKGYATQGLCWLNRLLLSARRPIALWAVTAPGNKRCQALLARCSYVRVSRDVAPELVGYESGDLVFRGQSAV